MLKTMSKVMGNHQGWQPKVKAISKGHYLLIPCSFRAGSQRDIQLAIWPLIPSDLCLLLLVANTKALKVTSGFSQ